jgi:hypothetical protein
MEKRKLLGYTALDCLRHMLARHQAFKQIDLVVNGNLGTFLEYYMCW